MISDKLHVVITLGFGEGWLIPINGLGTAEVDYKDERSVAKALREIADRFDEGMGYQAVWEVKDLELGT